MAKYWGASKRDIPGSRREGKELQEHLWEQTWLRLEYGNIWDAVLQGMAKCRYKRTDSMQKMEERVEEGEDMLEEEDDCTVNQWDPKGKQYRDVTWDKKRIVD